MTTYYYARVSDDDQNLNLQLDDARQHSVAREDVLLEYKTAKNQRGRPVFLNLLNNILKPGDTLLFIKLDRMGRDNREIQNTLHELRRRKIAYRATTQPCVDDTKQDTVNKLMVNVLGVFAEVELGFISDRTKLGMAAAAARGVKLGRPKKVRLNNEEKEEAKRA